MSYALREAIPIMQLIKEMSKNGIKVNHATPKIKCKVFEDNSGALEMAREYKYQPRTKHLNNRLHHFRDYVTRQEITIHPIGTHEQSADFLTKPLNETDLKRHRKKVMGW